MYRRPVQMTAPDTNAALIDLLRSDAGLLRVSRSLNGDGRELLAQHFEWAAAALAATEERAQIAGKRIEITNANFRAAERDLAALHEKGAALLATQEHTDECPCGDAWRDFRASLARLSEERGG